MALWNYSDMVVCLVRCQGQVPRPGDHVIKLEKLKITRFVQIIKKVRYIIKFARKANIVIEIDHLFFLNIIQPLLLTFVTLTIWFNLKLV